MSEEIHEEIHEELQTLNGTQKISLRITGEDMNAGSGYKLDSVLTSLSNFEKLVNKTYLHINDRDRFRESDSDKISIRLLEVKEGSFLSELAIKYQDIIVPALPLVINNSDMIWGAIKSSYDFIKAKTKAIKEGKEVVVTQNADGNVMNVSNNSNGIVNITVNNGIPDLANKLKPEFQAMARSIDGESVEKIEISELNDQGSVQNLSFDLKDKELFKVSTFTQDDEIAITGKIIDGNFVYKNGRIQIRNSSAIPDGEYKFSVSENLHAEEKWRDMFLQERPYYCKRRVEFDPSNPGLKVLEVIITDWDEKQWEDVG